MKVEGVEATQHWTCSDKMTHRQRASSYIYSHWLFNSISQVPNLLTAKIHCLALVYLHCNAQQIAWKQLLWLEQPACWAVTVKWQPFFSFNLCNFPHLFFTCSHLRDILPRSQSRERPPSKLHWRREPSSCWWSPRSWALSTGYWGKQMTLYYY